MRWLVFGTGGVGGFFGGKLAKAGEDVWFFARGKHLAAMKKHGLRVKSPEGSFRIRPGKMADKIAKVETPDVVLFCVKAYDTERAAEQLSPILSKDSIVISLQNGVENEATIQSTIQAGTVYGGVAYIFSNITAPGVITEWGGARKIVFGPVDGIVDERAREIVRVISRAGIAVKLSDDIRTDLWKKFIFIAAGGGFTTLTRLSLADVIPVQESRGVLLEAMKEAEAVARAKGIDIPHDFVEQQLAALQKHPTTARTSMYYDLVRGKPLEVEALSGAIVRFGLETGVSTPVNHTIYASLLPHHLMHVQKRKTPKRL